jgi:hypothetical protein
MAGTSPAMTPENRINMIGTRSTVVKLAPSILTTDFTRRHETKL